MTRKEAREAAFVLIFEKQMNDYSNEELIELAVESGEFSVDDYVVNVLNGVFNNLFEIDSKIKNNLNAWSINRISKTALAVLRLSIYEILFYDSIPVSVSINEAVEITKKFATKEDASFVNGVLSSVAKQINNE